VLTWAVSRPLQDQPKRCPHDSSGEPHSQGGDADLSGHLVRHTAGVGARRKVPVASSERRARCSEEGEMLEGSRGGGVWCYRGGVGPLSRISTAWTLVLDPAASLY